MEFKYYNRTIEQKGIELSQHYPVVVLSGPRQYGKSTLVKQLFSSYKYVNLERIDDRLFAEQDPRAFLEQFKSAVIIDEIQYVPKLFSYIQAEVDEKSAAAGQFILTGSCSLSILSCTAQSLAGRAAIFELLPLTQDEIRQNLIEQSLEQLISMSDMFLTN